MRIPWLLGTVLAVCTSSCLIKAADGNRLAYLDEVCDPYYVGRDFPKLTTPQWVGEDEVEAVVVLAIDDMRDTAKYETYLRPILDRLKRIDGRAPVSIMTCRVDPADPQLQTWLKEGLSIECHTIDHPCPLLQGGDFDKAKSTYDRCVDLMNEIPGNKPVAFRMPCCDSLNTPSPRFWTEIFSKTTENGNYLQIDTSVFNITTSKDKELPRELVLDADGNERFRKYLPFKSFVNTIEDYPYPYIIGGTCWEFPCIVPSDWEAQNIQQPNNPKTVEDMKAALDAVVIKQGTFNLVFHPHGWIRNDQVVELIDHAVEKHGRKVKFLTFRDAYERLKQNLLDGKDLGPEGHDSGTRLLDVDHDGYVDVINAGRLSMSGRAVDEPRMRLWRQAEQKWQVFSFPTPLVIQLAHNNADLGVKFGVLQDSGRTSILVNHKMGEFVNSHPASGIWHFDGGNWTRDADMWESLSAGNELLIPEMCEGVRFLDTDCNGVCELIVAPAFLRGSSNLPFKGQHCLYRLDQGSNRWKSLPDVFPTGISIAATKDESGPDVPDAGLRFVDINEDGHDDVIFSNGERYSLHLWKNKEEGWAIKVIEGVRGKEGGIGPVIPMIVRADGTNNGAWFHSRSMWVQNEVTNRLPDLVDRLSFDKMLEGHVE